MTLESRDEDPLGTRSKYNKMPKAPVSHPKIAIPNIRHDEPWTREKDSCKSYISAGSESDEVYLCHDVFSIKHLQPVLAYARVQNF